VSDLITLLILLTIGYVFGSCAEYFHFNSLKQRERIYLNLPTVTTEKIFDKNTQIEEMLLVHGCAVISSDYFKDFVAGMRNLLGLKLVPYESLMDRARREAILRMKKMAADYDLIMNMRIETSEIGNRKKNKVTCVEVMAYGTAVRFK
jgi:uncharacterized protein YbjQ (UPF0145 family)